MNARKKTQNLAIGLLQFNILYLFDENELVLTSHQVKENLSFHGKEGRAHSVHSGISEVLKQLGKEK